MSNQQGVTNQKTELISIYRAKYLMVKSYQPLNTSKQFMSSVAYTFLEELIHLHCQEVKNIIRKITTQVMSLLKCQKDNSFQDNLGRDIQEISETSGKSIILANLEKMIQFFLMNQCRGRNDKQIEGINLEIQCSLNYTCPICLKAGRKEGSISLKLIELEVAANTKDDQYHARTMSSIERFQTEKNIGQPKNRLQSIVQGLRKERQRKNQIKQMKFYRLRKWWETTGDLLFLEQNPLWTSQSDTLEQKRQILMKGLKALNTANEATIQRYCNNSEKNYRKRQSRSMSVKIDRSVSIKDDKQMAENTKLGSAKQINNPPRKNSCRKRIVVDVKTKKAPQIAGQNDLSRYLVRFDTGKGFLARRNTQNVNVNQMQLAIQPPSIPKIFLAR